MYMREGETRASAGPLPGTLRTALLVSVAGIFTLGLFPSLFVALSSAAGAVLP
jgi:hypothetical protein